MSWILREIKVPEYGWTVKCFDPTLAELKDIQAVSVSDWESMKLHAANLIDSWDVTDKKGNPLPVPTKEDSSSLDLVPPVVLKSILVGVLEVITKSLSDPKANTTDSPS